MFGEGYYTFLLDEWVYTEENARDKLQQQFGTQTLKGFGVQDMNHGIIASGAILQYLDLTQHTQTGHISTFIPYRTGSLCLAGPVYHQEPGNFPIPLRRSPHPAGCDGPDTDSHGISPAETMAITSSERCAVDPGET